MKSTSTIQIGLFACVLLVLLAPTAIAQRTKTRGKDDVKKTEQNADSTSDIAA